MNTKKITKLLSLALVVLLCASMLAACASIGSAAKYREATEKLEAGDYEAAYALFLELGDYKDSAKIAARFHYALVSYVENYTGSEGPGTETAVVTYNENNLPVQCVSTFADGHHHTCTLTFDANGQLTNRTCVSTADYGLSYDLVYDEKGNLMEESYTYHDGYIYTIKYTYDEKGYEATVEAYDNEGYYAFYEYTAYDENGNLLSGNAVDGSETLTFEVTYNADGLIESSIEREADGDVITVQYTYDANGNEIRMYSDKNGAMLDSKEHTYDAKNQLVGKIYTDNTGYSCTYGYTYDEHGCLIRYTEQDNEQMGCDREAVFKLVYVPYDYPEAGWDALIDSLYNW